MRGDKKLVCIKLDGKYRRIPKGEAHRILDERKLDPDKFFVPKSVYRKHTRVSKDPVEEPQEKVSKTQETRQRKNKKRRKP